MKFKSLFLLVLLGLVSLAPAMAQSVKIGYTNIEVILAYMPEMRTVEASLETYQSKLGERIQNTQVYAEQKLQEYMELKQANRLSPADAKAREDEITKLDADIKAAASQAEFDIMAKRQELMDPILKKLQDAIDATAKEKGYTIILNQTTSSGVSTILFGPEEDDITETVMKRLGIAIPQE